MSIPDKHVKYFNSPQMQHTDMSLYSDWRREHLAATGPQTLVHASERALWEREHSTGKAQERGWDRKWRETHKVQRERQKKTPYGAKPLALKLWRGHIQLCTFGFLALSSSPCSCSICRPSSGLLSISVTDGEGAGLTLPWSQLQ